VLRVQKKRRRRKKEAYEKAARQLTKQIQRRKDEQTTGVKHMGITLNKRRERERRDGTKRQTTTTKI